LFSINRSQNQLNQIGLYTGGSSTGPLGGIDRGLTSRRPLSLCCKGSAEDEGDEGVTYEMLLPACSVGGGEMGVTTTLLKARLLLGMKGVTGGWSVDAIACCFVLGMTTSEWAGFAGT